MNTYMSRAEQIKEAIEKILLIATTFFNLTNIKINSNKSVLVTNIDAGEINFTKFQQLIH